MVSAIDALILTRCSAPWGFAEINSRGGDELVILSEDQGEHLTPSIVYM